MTWVPHFSPLLRKVGNLELEIVEAVDYGEKTPLFDKNGEKWGTQNHILGTA
jgi:hypothetical protein